MRVKGGTTTRARHKKILAQTKGMRDGRSKNIKRAKEAILKQGDNSYRDRRNKKRSFRALWNIRIGAKVREFGLSYSKFIGALKAKNIELDRKVLAEIAAERPETFEKIIEKVK